MNRKSRSFLLLQGPIGPFFKELEEGLRRAGHSVKKVNFWGGDTAFFPDGISFTSPLSKWSNFFLRVCSKHAVTDIVLFGDRRPYHEVAIEVIAQANPEARVWVFEEGYFRPHWVTLDHYGVNARSSLPRTEDELFRKIAEISEGRDPGSQAVDPWIRDFAPTCMKYYFSGLLSSGSFPNFQYHRPVPPIRELWGWLRSYGERVAGRDSSGDLSHFLEAKGSGRHFIVPLQLETDFQMRKYSPFKKNSEFLEYVFRSFSKFARSDDHVVVKSHPYDYDWVSWKARVEELSRKYGIEDRVFFIHKCMLGDVLVGSSGCVTINSTFGLAALEQGVPVKALGKVFWNVDFLTTSLELDHFWEHPRPVNFQKFKLFKQYVMMQTQFNGGYYSEQGRRLLLSSVVDALGNWEQDTARLSKEPRERLFESRKSVSAVDTPVTPIRRKLDMSL